MEKIKVENGKARPVNPHSYNSEVEHSISLNLYSAWSDFESTIQWHDCPEATEDGEYTAYLEWQVIGCSWYYVDKAVADRLPNHSRQVWRIVSQLQEKQTMI